MFYPQFSNVVPSAMTTSSCRYKRAEPLVRTMTRAVRYTADFPVALVGSMAFFGELKGWSAGNRWVRKVDTLRLYRVNLDLMPAAGKMPCSGRLRNIQARPGACLLRASA